MNESPNRRFAIGLIVLAILCTVALGLQERRSAPLAAYSPLSPVDAAPRAMRPLQTLRQALARASQWPAWRTPWPWIVIGLVGFGGLAWGLIRIAQRAERD
jgi:hypothetical protein